MRDGGCIAGVEYEIIKAWDGLLEGFVMSERLVTIRNFALGPDPVSAAELARLKLEFAGIPCFLTGREFVAMYWLYSSADRGVKLQVRQSDAAEARKVLGAQAGGIDGSAAPQEEPKDVALGACPRCGSENVEYERFSKRLFYLSLLLLKFPLSCPKHAFRCNDCGYAWKARPGAAKGGADESAGNGGQ